MPYALIDPKDGLEPGWNYVGGPGVVVPPNVYWGDNQPPSGLVWDALTKTLRPPSAVEILAIARKNKKIEFANRMHRENRALYPEVSEVEGAWVAEAMIDIITEPRGVRVASIKANRDKRARFYALVDGALTVDALSLLTWETA